MNIQDKPICRKSSTNENKRYEHVKLIEAVSHFEKPVLIDKQSLFFTINVTPSEFKNIRTKIAPVLNEIATGERYPKTQELLSKRPGFVLYDDLAGSRYHYVRNEQPHFHGVIILPDYYPNDAFRKFEKEKFRVRAEIAIKRIYGVKDVQIEHPDESKSIIDWCDYASKALRSKQLDGSESYFPEENVYPFNFDQNAKRLGKARKDEIEAKAKKSVKEFFGDAGCFFSVEHLMNFGDELEATGASYNQEHITRHKQALAQNELSMQLFDAGSGQSAAPKTQRGETP